MYTSTFSSSDAGLSQTLPSLQRGDCMATHLENKRAVSLCTQHHFKRDLIYSKAQWCNDTFTRHEYVSSGRGCTQQHGLVARKVIASLKYW